MKEGDYRRVAAFYAVPVRTGRPPRDIESRERRLGRSGSRAAQSSARLPYAIKHR